MADAVSLWSQRWHPPGYSAEIYTNFNTSRDGVSCVGACTNMAHFPVVNEGSKLRGACRSQVNSSWVALEYLDRQEDLVLGSTTRVAFKAKSQYRIKVEMYCTL